MSKDEKKLEDLSVQDHLDEIQGRTESRPKVVLEDATADEHLQAIRGEIELVPRSQMPQDEPEDGADDQAEEVEPERKPEHDLWSVEEHLQQIQNRKRGA